MLGLSKFSHGIRDKPWERGGTVPEVQRRTMFKFAVLPRVEARSLKARHVLIGSVFPVLIKSLTRFSPFCQGFLRMKRGHRIALEHVCGCGINKGPPN